MKKLFFFLSLILMPLIMQAQNPFQGKFINSDFNLRLNLNLYEANIPQPQFDDEMCYGILAGSTNGHWVILKVNEIDESKATVRAISDSGIEAQTLEIKLLKDNSIEIKQVGSTNIRGVKNSKYVKLPKPIPMTRK
ncbi:MAG: hypothetical protein IJ607_05965 [Bacteroidaceae bacterium]|nr:hypothetical protein [Bacteroidaceae bacterium]